MTIKTNGVFSGLYSVFSTRILVLWELLAEGNPQDELL